MQSTTYSRYPELDGAIVADNFRHSPVYLVEFGDAHESPHDFVFGEKE